MGYRIEKNVPRPTHRHNTWKTFPFNTMVEGDSFFITELPRDTAEARKCRDRWDARVRLAAKAWEKSLGLKIVISIQKVEESGKDGLRCWVNEITDLSRAA